MIVYSNNSFYLETEHTSYVIRILDNGAVSNAYYGRKIGRENLKDFSIMRFLSYSLLETVDEESVGTATVARELPTYGRGDFGLPAISVVGSDFRFVNELVFESYEILDGKPILKGLPSFDKNVENIQTLKLVLRDSISGYKANLYYSVYEKEDAITRWTEVENISGRDISIKAVASASIDFPARDFDMTTLKGGWAKERSIERYPLHQGISSVESRRGSSSHQLNPFLALSEKETTEEHGDVYGFALVYSADFKMSVEVSEMDYVRVIAGINSEYFDWRLQPGENFVTPECVLTYSDEGFSGMSRHFHDLCRNHLGKCADREVVHPIVINNWEATYFDFNEEKIIRFIKSCKGLGIDTMVLDDGWFGHRDADNSSLGDWVIDRKKFPNGLDRVIKTCHEQNMKFGIWFEPEMISRDSQLYREHPDWCIHTEQREPLEGRNQLIIDMSRTEVVDYLFQVISTFLSENRVSYVKWDMNRSMTDQGAAWLENRQGEYVHRYILGVYDLMERLVNAHPNVFFEGCAGGGGRFDFGILYYMPQIWTSDDSDAIERLRIQYGTSLVYPPTTMVAHVSAVPNHQTGRVTPFKTRSDVAQMCNFGYELNVDLLPNEKIRQIPKQVEEHKRIDALIRYGTFYRLINPFETKQCAWELVSDNKEQAYVMLAAVSISANDRSFYLKLKGLEPEYTYWIEELGVTATGATIMNMGIPIRKPLGEYETRTFFLQKQ